jgi:2-dehydro-3-deoxyphosphogluconate aldolase/(4S)-4-hydroxy-2-oxoglutarate aldolase
MTVPNAANLIRELSSPHSGVTLGAGTVLTPEQAEKCIEAGAQFIVSPAFDAETVRFCRDNKIAVMPGCLTPTEVLTAWNAGADCVKVFPCDALGGARYLKILKTLFPHIEMMPTGGVSCETIADFFSAGAIAVGVGTDLVDVNAIRQGNLNVVAEKARNYLEIVNRI